MKVQILVWRESAGLDFSSPPPPYFRILEIHFLEKRKERAKKYDKYYADAARTKRNELLTNVNKNK